MSSRRNRDRNQKSALRNINDLPAVSYEDAANGTYGKNEEIVNQWFGDIDPSTLKDSGIQVAEDGTIQAYNFNMTEIGLDPDNLSLDRENWQHLGELLFRFDRSIQWLIGDWLTYGETNKWGETEEIANQMGYEVKTLYDYKWVAQNVNFSVRTEKLSFGHHKLVASIKDPEEQRQWLQRAEYGDFDEDTQTTKPWSISRLRDEMRGPADESDETTFDRSLKRIDREITKRKWEKLPRDERLKRYEYMNSILKRMRDWGFE